MGNYLNPGNSGFAVVRNDIYVDKTGMIGLLNQTIDTPRRLTCISRPRRFELKNSETRYYTKLQHTKEVLFNELSDTWKYGIQCQ